MEKELLRESNKQNAKILITQIYGEIDYVEKYLAKLKDKVDELKSIIDGI